MFSLHITRIHIYFSQMRNKVSRKIHTKYNFLHNFSNMLNINNGIMFITRRKNLAKQLFKRLSVETNNLRDWKSVPDECASYGRMYMEGGQYRLDCDKDADAAIGFARGMKVEGDGKDVWVFDIDETALSNLPFYAKPDVAFGTRPFSWTTLVSWIKDGRAPALPFVLRLYNELVALKYKITSMTRVANQYKQIRASNLKNAGYNTWEKLILK